MCVFEGGGEAQVHLGGCEIVRMQVSVRVSVGARPLLHAWLLERSLKFELPESFESLSAGHHHHAALAVMWVRSMT